MYCVMRTSAPSLYNVYRYIMLPSFQGLFSLGRPGNEANIAHFDEDAFNMTHVMMSQHC